MLLRQRRTNHLAPPHRTTDELIVSDTPVRRVDHHERWSSLRATELQRHGVPVSLCRAGAPAPEDQINVRAILGNPAEGPMNELCSVCHAVSTGKPPDSATILPAALATLEVRAAGRLEGDFVRRHSASPPRYL